MIYREFTWVLLVMLLAGGSHIESMAPEGPIIDPTSCYRVEGSVIDKTIEGGDDAQVFVLWVIANGNTELSGGWRVHVSQSTWENAEIGEQFERFTCDLLVGSDWLLGVDNLIGTGVLTPIG